MASTRQPKERTAAAAATAATAAPARRAPRASLTGSPDRVIPKTPDKPTPNYLKPTVRKTGATTKAPNTTTTTTGTRVPARKPTSSSLSTQPQRPPSRERAPKTTSPSPSPKISPRPSLDKSSRSSTSLISKTKAPSGLTKRGPGTTRSALSSALDPYASDTSSIVSETEEKELPVLHIDEPDPVDHIDLVKDGHVVLDELTDSFALKEPEEEIVSVSVSAPQVEQIEDAGVAKDDIHDDDAHHVEENNDEKDENIDEKESPVVNEDVEVVIEEGEAAHEEKAPDVASAKETAVTKPSEAHPVVVVRQPEVWKKEAPKNNEVIEEFKSKLMEKRKNKVLALVGAFETVISLQEPGGQPSQQPAKAAAPPEDGGSAGKEAAEET